MLEENKTVELTDEQLEQVSGGKEQIKSDTPDITTQSCAKKPYLKIKFNGITEECLSGDSNNDLCKGCAFFSDSNNLDDSK